MLKAVGFDLDNTLYDQADHMSAFARHVAKRLSELADVAPAEAERVFLKKWQQLTSYHPHLFDEVLKELHVPNSAYVKELVDQYHRFRAELKPFHNTESVLQRLSDNYQLFIVTDGNLDMQRWKVEVLQIARYFSLVVYTGQYGSEWTKPSTIPFLYAAECLGRSPGECAYIGDNPMCDFKGAREAGMTTIRVLTGPFADYVPTEEQLPHYVVDRVEAIEEVLGVCAMKLATTSSVKDGD
jgi:putative hydrolase of the HAD superfamily